MKLFVAVVVLVSISVLDAKIETDANTDECAKKLNIKDDVVNKLFDGEIKAADITQDMKCFFDCFAEKEGIAKSGKIQTSVLNENLTAYSDSNTATEIISKCKDVKGTGDCEFGYNLVACIVANMPKKKA